MKLIVDVDEEYYKNGTLVNYFNCYSKQLDEIIYNGTPLEEELDKLKKKINSEDVNCRYDEYAYSSGLQKAIEVIDNRIKELKGE